MNRARRLEARGGVPSLSPMYALPHRSNAFPAPRLVLFSCQKASYCLMFEAHPGFPSPWDAINHPLLCCIPSERGLEESSCFIHCHVLPYHVLQPASQFIIEKKKEPCRMTAATSPFTLITIPIPPFLSNTVSALSAFTYHKEEKLYLL